MLVSDNPSVAKPAVNTTPASNARPARVSRTYIYKHPMSYENSIEAWSWRRLYHSRAKLKATSHTSALLSGFAMIAMVEINIDKDLPEPLLITFGICTTLLISVHLIALMISVCILPTMEAVSVAHGHDNHIIVTEAPHETLKKFVDLAWGFSTVIGIMLFMAEISILAWMKFYKTKNAAIASTVVIVPASILFLIFSLYFYRILMIHKYERSSQGLEELEIMATQLENNTATRVV